LLRNNDAPAVAALAPTQEYAEQMTRLGVWFVRYRLASGRLRPRRAADALTRWVNIYRLTALWDGVHDPASGYRDPEWERLTAGLLALLRRFPLDEAAELEERAVDVLRPWLRPRPEGMPGKVFGWWSYEVVGEGIADGPGLLGRVTNVRKISGRLRQAIGIATPGRHIALHFANASAPRSPFADASSLACALHTLIRDCRRHHPSVEFVWCQSWLNSYEPFLALFPPSWRASAVARTPEQTDARSFGRACLNTRNWWGQFMRSDGSFHTARGRRFRRAGGIFPYANCFCHERIDVLEQFLANRTADRAVVGSGAKD
jgi:hypothetical protein